MSKKSVIYQLTLNSACFTSWSSSILFLRLISGRVYRCDRANLPQPNISRCMFWPSFVPLLRIPCHNQMFGFFWQLPETFSSLLLFDTQTYVVLHHCHRILDISQLTLRCHSLSPQNVSILSHDRTRAARRFFFFFLSHIYKWMCRYPKMCISLPFHGVCWCLEASLRVPRFILSACCHRLWKTITVCVLVKVPTWLSSFFCAHVWTRTFLDGSCVDKDK